MELINKEELINKINAYMITTPDVTMVRKLIDECATTEIVRCKDCLYATEHVIDSVWTCAIRRDFVNGNGYCHMGELRGEE